jgi:hypothetical protein
MSIEIEIVKERFWQDHRPDITLTVKTGLEASGLFEVHAFNDPELALSSFKPETI